MPLKNTSKHRRHMVVLPNFKLRVKLDANSTSNTKKNFCCSDDIQVFSAKIPSYTYYFAAPLARLMSEGGTLRVLLFMKRIRMYVY